MVRGDLIVGALGRRAATLEGVGDWRAVDEELELEALTSAGLLGFGVFLAILLHKPLDALSIETVLAAAGHSGRRRHWINLGFSILCPVVAVVFWYSVELSPIDGRLLAAALSFSAGAFICIALGDLLPEIQFHSHDRGKLTLLFLLGITLAWAIGAVEPPHSL